MSFTVAIIGRPNVGKSTLFNRLVGRRLAIVHDTPGVTRDRREGEAHLFGIDFRVIDTAGLEEAFDDSVAARMRSQTETALQDADLILMLIDARAGVTPLDKHFADHLRKSPKRVIVVANKCEGRAGAGGLIEAYELGLGEPVPLSAEHNEGMADLFDAILPTAIEHGAAGPTADEEEGEDEDEGDAAAEGEGIEEDDKRPLKVAIVGRPNVGKSTLVNRLLGEDRMLTGPEAGLTRDAIAVEWAGGTRPIVLVDTAGLRRRANISDQLEKMSVANSIEAIRHAHVVILVLDAEAILDKQDLTIARLVIDEGRGLVVAVNKWDVVEDRGQALSRLEDRLQTSLPQARGVATVTISALTGRGLDRLMAAVERTYDVWKSRIPTAQLNRWLADMVDRHPPPAVQGGRRLKLRYMTQVKARPPTFAVFTSRPEDLPESYLRFLVNGLRETFDMPGVPIRLNLRKRKNPFADGA